MSVLFVDDGVSYRATGYYAGTYYQTTTSPSTLLNSQKPWTYVTNGTDDSWWSFYAEMKSTYATLYPNQGLMIESCASGTSISTTRETASAVIGITKYFSTIKFEGFNSWTKMNNGLGRSVCTQALIPAGSIASWISQAQSNAFNFQVWSEAVGGYSRTDDGGAHGITFKTLPTSQSGSMSPTFQGTYSNTIDAQAATILYCPQTSCSVIVFFSGYKSIESNAGSMPWTYTSASFGNNFYYYMTIPDATPLAGQRIDVSFTLGGAATSFNNNYEQFIYICVNGTAGSTCSARTWGVGLASGLATQMHVPFVIPNNYIVDGATINFYGNSLNSGSTKIGGTLLTYRITMYSQYEQIETS